MLVAPVFGSSSGAEDALQLETRKQNLILRQAKDAVKKAASFSRSICTCTDGYHLLAEAYALARTDTREKHTLLQA
jgi:hypothetical protein